LGTGTLAERLCDAIVVVKYSHEAATEEVKYIGWVCQDLLSAILAAHGIQA
jgi:hypothetical protein